MRFAVNPFTDQLDIVSQTGSGLPSVETITGNSGGPVGPDGAFNINLVGDNTTGLTVVGSPGSSSLTIFGIPSSSTQIGTTRYATNAEAAAQTSSTVALTPSNITSLFSTSPLPSSQGGTGLSSPAANQLIVTNGSSAYTLLGVAGNGQIPIGSIGSDPVLGNLTSSGGTLTITNGPGTINIETAGGGVGVDSFSPDTGTDPVVPTAGGLVDVQGQATPNVSGIQVTGGLNRLDVAMFSPFGGGDFGFVAADNGGTQTVFAENTSNTASSDAAFSAIVGGTSAGDPYSHWVIPATRFYAAGIDNSDSDTWKLTTDVSPVSPSTGTTLLSMTSAGALTIPTLTGVLTGNGASAITANAITQYAVVIGGASNAVASTSVGSAGQVLQSSGAGVNPAYSTATYPATTTINQVLYSSANNVVGGITASNNGVLISGTTGIPSWLAAGSTGQVLTATTGSPPSWSSNGTGDVAGPASSTDNALVRFDGTTGKLIQNGVITEDDIGNLSISAAVSGTSLSATVANTSNTASATAFYNAQVAGSTADDAYYKAEISGGQAWTLGLDNSDSDAFVISASATPGTTNIMRVSTAGEINYPLQPAFSGFLSANDSNVTGDATTFRIGSGNVFTEVFDQNSDFNTNGTFTAPVTGRYYINVIVFGRGFLVGHTLQNIAQVTSNRTYFTFSGSGFVLTNPSGDEIYSGSAFADMDVGDTYTVTFQVSNGTKVVDVGQDFTFMSGYLAC